MDETEKFAWARTPILNVTLELDDFKKIHTLLQARQSIILERDKKVWIEKNPDADEEKKKELFDQADLDYRVSTTVTYANGEDLTFFDIKEFDKNNLGDDIRSIMVDSSRVHEFRNRKRIFPNVTVRIDFHDNSSFSPFAILTAGTQNESNILLVGQDLDWCTRTQSEISNIISNRRNFRNLLHAKFVYDFSMYLICVPLFFDCRA